MKKAEKSIFIENLSENLKGAKSVILIDFAGLSMALQTDLKKKLKEVGATMTVAKNTLFRLAGENAKLPKETLEDTVLTGQTAIIMAEEDPIAPLSILANFAKENEVPSLKVGIVEGAFQEKEALVALSKLPGKEVLQASAIGAIGAPLYKMNWVLTSNLQKLLYILDQKAKGGE